MTYVLAVLPVIVLAGAWVVVQRLTLPPGHGRPHGRPVLAGDPRAGARIDA